ncbi:MAG TPA: porin [Hyphomicrobium sp.]|nr:porin [Hyphomicrobium sp.]
MKARLLAAAMGAATVLGGGNAFAADLGGNCCADLEERIAELEATTARKGNRKVSLTITGWVSSQLYWFDDGVESNVYVVDNNNDLSSNVKFTGTAQISPGWKAGYSLWIYTNGPSSLGANENWDASRGNWGLQVENSYWFIQSDSLGKLSVGKQSLAADNAALGTDFSGTLFPANGVTFDGGGLGIAYNGAYLFDNLSNDGRARWMNSAFWCEHADVGIANDCAGLRLNGVRYDTPTFAGFTIGASWGEDDYWDVALRYSGEFSGFKLAFATAYSESTDAGIGGGVTNDTNDNQYFQVGGMIKHMPSGLWVHGTWGRNWIDNGPNYNLNTECGGPCPDDITGWYLKAGWTTKFSALGNTHFYGEYGENKDAFVRGLRLDDDPITLVNPGIALRSTDATRYGVGVVQEIDAAAMSLWAKWRHHELDGTLANGEKFSADDVDMFLAGAVIFY